MIPIKVNRSPESELRHNLYIADILKNIEIKSTINNTLVLLLISVFVIFLDRNNFLDGDLSIFLLFLWGVFIVMKLLKVKKFYNLFSFLKNEAPKSFDPAEVHYFSFDQSGIIYKKIRTAADEDILDYKWTNLDSYIIKEESVYLLTQYIYLNIALSEEEIGRENVEKLKEVVRQNLPEFKLSFNPVQDLMRPGRKF